MYKGYWLWLFFVVCTSGAIGQAATGKLTGKVTDQSTNEPLLGVSISAKNTKYGISSITDGTYILSLPAGTYTILYSFTGYKTKEITGVVVKAGESAYLDIILESGSKQLESVVVTSSVRRESQSSVYNAQKRSAAASDGISTEAIRRTPDNNAGQILKRVTGVNVQDNRFVVVRGLGEQYNQTILNGAPMTSTETNRNAFAFDLIPASVIDNITVNKTATPDMPGNFAGGIVQINTRDFPANDFFSITLQAGFSDQTYNKDFYSDKRDHYEWLGFGARQRELPKHFPASTSRVPFTELNLQEQFRYLRMLNNNLAPVNQGPSGFNENVQFGYGKTIRFKGESQLGIIAAISQRKTELIEQEIVARDPVINFPSLSSGVVPAEQNLVQMNYYSENTRYRYNVDVGGVLNIAYRFGSNKVSLKNLFTQVLSNQLIDRTFIASNDFSIPDAESAIGLSYITEQRRMLNSILAGEHRTGKNNETRLDWNVNATSNHINSPDTRNFFLFTDSVKSGYHVNTNAYSINDALEGYSRIWSLTKDFIYGGVFNITTPFTLGKNKQLFKGGILFQNRQRKATGTVLPIQGLKAGTIDSILAPSSYYPGGGQVVVSTADLVGGTGNYNASSSLLAAYESLENKIGDQWRIIWGIRVENYQQSVNVYSPVFFDNFNEPELKSEQFAARSTFNFLPSVNIVYSPLATINLRGAYSNTVIRPELKDLAEFRRFDFQTFTLATGNGDLKSTSVQNFDLKVEWFPSSGEIVSVAAFYKKLKDPIEYARSTITNLMDIRTSVNTGNAFVRGIEAEVRKKLDFFEFAPWLSHVTLFGNGSLIKSKVAAAKLTNDLVSSTNEHTLTGQPNYIVNGGVTISLFKNSFEATMSVNRTGDYINELGTSDLIPLNNGNAIPLVPHFRVKARNMADLVITQNFLHNKGKIKINVSNLFNKPYILYQDLDGNGKFDEPVVIKKYPGARTFLNYVSGIDNTASSIRPQRTYSLSVSYTF